jgi:hypothetical protein
MEFTAVPGVSLPKLPTITVYQRLPPVIMAGLFIPTTACFVTFADTVVKPKTMFYHKLSDVPPIF